MNAELGLLNIGCGTTFHPQWINVDFNAASSGVIAYDIRKGLPFADGAFHGCYSSHLLEHLTPIEGVKLLGEIHRVLVPGGIVRVVVPDLELVARDYLQTLERALSREAGADDDYDWMMIQLLDQSVRRATGGAMAEFWRDATRRNVQFVVARAGAEAEQAIAESRAGTAAIRRGLLERVRSRTAAQLVRAVQRHAARILVGAVAGRSVVKALDEGLFRNSGEIHHWMYDRYSLVRLLEHTGFIDVHVASATESLIPQFASFELDVIAGRVRKPDSLFVEATKAAPAGGNILRGAP